jgi:hypothetical protein
MTRPGWSDARIVLAAGLLLALGLPPAVTAIRSDWQSIAARGRERDFLTREVERYEPLTPSLPRRGTVGYLQPEDWPGNDAVLRFYLAEYALTPRIIVPGTGPEFVIVVPEAGVDDQDGRGIPSRDGRLPGFVLYARAANGLRVFRRIQ